MNNEEFESKRKKFLAIGIVMIIVGFIAYLIFMFNFSAMPGGVGFLFTIVSLFVTFIGGGFIAKGAKESKYSEAKRRAEYANEIRLQSEAQKMVAGKAPSVVPQNTASVGTVKYCPECGTQNALENKFCRACGLKFEE